MFRYKKNVEEGDTVVLYIGPKKMHSVLVTPYIRDKNGQLVDNVFQTCYGAVHLRSLIGVKYGTKVQLDNGYIYVLHLTPELWTETLPHRTQIMYSHDISLIIFSLEIKPGSIVLEAGTGSGSMTHALARAVFPNGHVHTFEFHEERVKLAKHEFSKHGIDDIITIHHRDVCNDGFGEDMNNTADAVFLDLPAPWLAIPFAAKALKQTEGKIATFSPCIEQTKKTHDALKSNGFVDITTCECVQREFTVAEKDLVITPLHSDPSVCERETEKVITCIPSSNQVGHTGYITCATLPPLGLRALLPVLEHRYTLTDNTSDELSQTSGDLLESAEDDIGVSDLFNGSEKCHTPDIPEQENGKS